MPRRRRCSRPRSPSSDSARRRRRAGAALPAHALTAACSLRVRARTSPARPSPDLARRGANFARSRPIEGMDHNDRDAALDELAGSLRDRLLGEAAEHADGDLHERIRELVDREAGLLDDDARARLWRPASPSARSASARSSRCSATRPSTRSWSTAPSSVWVERDGRIEPTSARFAGESDLRHAIERILAPLGRRVDEAEPLCDARLPDGSRVNVVVRAAGARRLVLTIRRFRPRGFGPARARRQRHLGTAAARPAAHAPCARAATCSSAAAPARARRRRSTR